MPIEWDEPVPSSGKSGGGSGDGVFEEIRAGFSKEAVGSMASEAKAMLDSAKSGGFRVSPEGAEPIMDVLDEMKERVRSLSHELMGIATMEPTLGDHAYGKIVASYQHRAFTAGNGSATAVLDQLYYVLEDSREALRVAVEKYQNSEGEALNAFKGQA